LRKARRDVVASRVSAFCLQARLLLRMRGGFRASSRVGAFPAYRFIYCRINLLFFVVAMRDFVPKAECALVEYSIVDNAVSIKRW